MSENLESKIIISADASQAKTEVGKFESAFSKAMKELGKTPAEIKALREIGRALNEDATAADHLDAETRGLVATYKSLRDLASARDTLKIIPHQRIKEEIDQVSQAYARLKTSGKLTHEELAQAGLKAQQRINELKEGTNGWAQALGTAKTELAALGGSLAGLGAAAKQAIDFEAAMGEVAKVADGTEAEMAGLAEQIKALSAELPISADGLAQIAAAGGSLGIPIGKLAEFTALAGKMGIAFGLSADQAGQAVAQLSNIFGLPLDGVRSLGDAINVLGNNTSATEDAILAALTRIGGTAKQFGLAADQASALASALISLGKPPEVAANAINALLSRLQTANVQTPQFKAALDGLGVSASELANKIRQDPQAALLEFLQTLEGLDAQTRAEKMTLLFGREYQDDISLVVGALGKYREALALVNDQNKVNGAMEKEFLKRMETTQSQIDLLKNSVEVLGINLGNIFLPAINAVAGGLADATQAAAGFADKFPAITALATGFVTLKVAVGGLNVLLPAAQMGIAKLATGAAGLSAALGATIGQLGKLNLALSVLSAFTAGWEFGTYLKNEFVEVEQAGIALAGGLAAMAERARFAFEVLSTPVGPGAMDQIGAAYDRMQVKLQQIDDEYADLFAQAGKTAEEQKQGADQATAALDGVNTAAKGAGQAGRTAAEQILAGLDQTAAGAGQTAAAIEASLGGIGLAALEQYVTGMIASLNGASLSQFAASLHAAFQSGQADGAEMARINDAVLTESFKRLGLTAATELGRISPAAQEAIASLDAIRLTLEQTSASGAAKMAALGEAVQAALARADSVAAVTSLKLRIEAWGVSGELAGEQLERALEGVQDRLDDLQPGINSVAEAFKKLGITSQEAMRQTAAEAREAYEVIRKSGAPLADQRAAWLAWAKTAVESGDAQKIALAEVEASSLGLSAELDRLSGKQDKVGAAGDKAAAGLDKQAEATDKAKDKAEAAGDKMEEAGDKGEKAAVKITTTWEGVARQFGIANDLIEDYGDQMIRAFDEAMKLGQGGDLSQVAAAMQAAALGARALDRAIADMSSSGASGVEDLRQQLLELTGTEDQIAASRTQRDMAERMRQIQLNELEARRARMSGDNERARQLEQENGYLQEQIALIGQISRAEAGKKQSEAVAEQLKTAATKVVNVNFRLPNGQVRQVQTVNGTDKDLLESLKTASLVS